ncbi:RNA polymerase sigma factor [Frankia gtarii]|uniref:RNA polymerase sigma factor n=1 Tax=Frankia gtarii TaxID=2950102 RepID=UPI0021BF8CF7|nr:sigma-70 family RNA polymerase sigma factor [Frankia gtarii]
MPARTVEQPFEELFRTHHQAVLRFARRRLGDDTAAWDVVSETFLAAWRSRDRRPPTAQEVLPWLYGIAGNAVRNQRRAGARESRLVARMSAAGAGPASSAVTEDIAEESGRRDGALAAFGQLGEDDRELLRLVAWEGLDLTGLAAALFITPSTAKVRLHRARRRLQAALRGVVEPEIPAVPAPRPIEGRF